MVKRRAVRRRRPNGQRVGRLHELLHLGDGQALHVVGAGRLGHGGAAPAPRLVAGRRGMMMLRVPGAAPVPLQLGRSSLEVVDEAGPSAGRAAGSAHAGR